MSPSIAYERDLHHVRRNIAGREGRVGRLLRQLSTDQRDRFESADAVSLGNG